MIFFIITIRCNGPAQSYCAANPGVSNGCKKKEPINPWFGLLEKVRFSENGKKENF